MPDAWVRPGPLVTVCVPTIGRSGTLRETLESLRSQSFSDYEVIVLDNASPPDAQEEISAYINTDPRASARRSAVRIPMFDNFQRGVDAASGRYLAFFHDDDVYAPEFLEEQIGFLQSHPAVGFVGSNWKIIDADGNAVGNRNLIRTTEVWPGWRYIETLFALGSNVLPMPGIAFRRDVLGSDTFKSAQGAHFSDFTLLMRIAEDHDVGLIARQLVTLRAHSEQASLQLAVGESLRLRTAIFTAYCDDLEARRPEKRSYVEKLRRSIRSARRTSAVWTWLQASDSQAAAASRVVLSDEGIDRWLRYCLELADLAGVGSLLRKRRVQRRIKNAAYFVVNRTR